jgi:rod shape-determining protein MreC
MNFIYSKTFAVVFGCLVLLVILGLLYRVGWLDPVRYAILAVPRPITRVTSKVTRPIQNFFSTIYRLRSIANENGELRAKVSELQNTVVLLNQYKQENDTLRVELGFVRENRFSLEPCSVLSIDPQSVTDAMIINCGKNKNIQVGMPVVSSNYLVGKIIYVGNLTSTVVLLSSSQSSVDAVVSGGEVSGVVRGTLGSSLVFDLVPQNSELKSGEILVTAGISQIPKNIIIGELGELVSRPSDLFKKMTVKSPIRFNDLDFVFVVK